MATIEQNEQMWDRSYGWPDGGDVWSSGWGGPGPQWHRWIAPRVRAAVGGGPPGRRVVEIGCGHGRWTQFLAGSYREVTAVDLSQRCVDHCAKRFADVENVRVSRCDGRTLPGVDDHSISLVFSFDSLVHADAEVIDAYLAEAARVLTPDGVVFVHHSNLGAYRWNRSRRLRRMTPLVRGLAAIGALEPEVHWRDPTVDADLVVATASRHGLVCVRQELLRWGTRRAFIDCISVVVREGTAAHLPLERVHNTRFDDEMSAVARQAQIDEDTG